MMINTARKGKSKESKCCAELREEGYLTWQAIRTKYHNNDLWGLFDVAAIHPVTGILVLIQCKSNRCDGETRDKVRAFKLPAGCQKWIWIWKDAKGWIKEFYQ